MSEKHTYKTLVTDPRQRRSLVGSIAFAIAAGLLFAAVMWMVAPSAKADTNQSTGSTWQQPYGGCKEGSRAPHSAGARECRQHGWIVRPRLVVNPGQVIVMIAMPRCINEDGSYLRKDGTVGVQRHCYWDDGRKGNRMGFTAIVDQLPGRTMVTWVTFP